MLDSRHLQSKHLITIPVDSVEYENSPVRTLYHDKRINQSILSTPLRSSPERKKLSDLNSLKSGKTDKKQSDKTKKTNEEAEDSL